jgi:hypothetical protein
MRCRKEEQDRRGIEQQCHDQDKPPHGLLIGGADQRCQVAHRAKISLRRLALTIDGSLLDTEIKSAWRKPSQDRVTM